MKLKKPKFWDLKKPSLFSILLLPFTILLIINNLLIKFYKKRKSKNVKTICIGNIYIGGTGKTPTTIKLYEILKNLKFKVSVGKKFHKSHKDEKEILEKKTNLISMNTREEIIKNAEQNNEEIVIFDDGLQEKKVDYNLKFVCFDANNLIGNGLLIPSGPLRENLNSLKRYNAVFIKHDFKNEIEINFESKIKKINPQIRIFNIYYMPVNLNDFDLSKKFIIFSGIGNPDSFKNLLQKNNFNIIEENIYPDHFDYTQTNIDKILKRAKQIDAEIVTTEKDFSKISKLNYGKINYLKIDLKINNEKEFINFLETSINEIY